jgi:hypothetical protein
MPDLSRLPAPVARYLSHVLPQDQPPIRRLYQRQRGELRTSAQSKRWFAFQAEQVTNPIVVSYVWDARVHLLPLVHLSVRDAYAGGRASSHVKLLSRITVGAASTPPVRSAECIPPADGRRSAADIARRRGKATSIIMSGGPTCSCPPSVRLAGITAAVGKGCGAGAFLNRGTSSCNEL